MADWGLAGSVGWHATGLWRRGPPRRLFCSLAENAIRHSEKVPAPLTAAGQGSQWAWASAATEEGPNGPAGSGAVVGVVHVMDQHDQRVAIIDPVHDLVDVLLEMVQFVILELLPREQLDGVVGRGAEPLPDLPVVGEPIVSLGVVVPARLARDLPAVERTASEFEDHLSHIQLYVVNQYQ